MRITRRHRNAEARFRQLLETAGVPPPDEVDYDPVSVVFLWHDRRLAVFVDLDDPTRASPDRRPTSIPGSPA